jgi:hypothetical protein
MEKSSFDEVNDEFTKLKYNTFPCAARAECTTGRLMRACALRAIKGYDRMAHVITKIG